MLEHYIMDVMNMETLQIRLTKNMINRIDYLVKIGEYPNRSEAVRDSVRNLLNIKAVPNEVMNISGKELNKYIKT